MDPYRPEQWHDFFMMVGGGAATLTGFVVVAMSLHIDVVEEDPALRHRARAILTGLSGVFMRSALVLIGGQSGRAVAAELFTVCAAVAAIGAAGLWQLTRKVRPTPRDSILRSVGSLGCYMAELTGAVVLFSGSVGGLYVVAAAMVANFFFMISGAWLLLVGVSHDEALHHRA